MLLGGLAQRLGFLVRAAASPDTRGLRRVAIAVLFGLLIGIVTMPQKHAAHHALITGAEQTHAAAQPAGSHHSGMHGSRAAGGHSAHSTSPDPPASAATSDVEPGGTGGFDWNMTLKLCLAMLVGASLLRAARGSWRRVLPAVLRLMRDHLPTPPRLPRHSLRQRPPSVPLITLLCVLRR